MILKVVRSLWRVFVGGKTPVFETMTKVSFGGWDVRVWREEDSFHSGPDTAIESLVIDCIENGFSCKEIAMSVGNQPRVSAIEVLAKSGNGGLFYPDWK